MDPYHLKQMAISHFQQLYSEVPVESRPIISYFPALTDKEFHSLSAPILSPEVKQAVDGMAPYKALGPDGLQAVFYQKSWHTVEAALLLSPALSNEDDFPCHKQSNPKVLGSVGGAGNSFFCETENAIYEGKFALTKQLYLPNAKFGSDVE
ncbi:hypothetical protein Ddye_016889 [Dipteronia dyeriana]|uniref:Uncharacterized protein n=1 Tax=Dipteronia dyeriana TaxID=168575 RepID=A0AAD9U7K0_9ROSI|nr:hypothetical protein Ddye_016889 [Dipteronia dyeriana]